MNFPFYIARRYLVSKKSHNVINIITGIAISGVTIGTMALIIILSVFNGFEKLTISLYSSFNPDLVITAKAGKTFDRNKLPVEKLLRIPGVLSAGEYIEENALLKYKDRQYIATIKGVSQDFERLRGFDTTIAEGKFLLADGEKDFCVLGYGVAASLGANLEDYSNPILVFVPRRDAGFSAPLENAFTSEAIFPAGYFSIQQDFDVQYVIVPFRFLKKLLDYNNEITGTEIKLAGDVNPDDVQQTIKETAGGAFQVKNRLEQQPLLYKIMKTEKWAIFLILTFILFIATFNVIGSLSMLIIDKKRDISILKSLGADLPLIKRIFLVEGMLISLSGAFAGLILGGIICRLQQVFGFVKMGAENSTFVVSYYPVVMKSADFIVVAATVLVIGFAATWYPVYNIRKISTMIEKED
jgi:lipoprotein-releasing system permease protein